MSRALKETSQFKTDKKRIKRFGLLARKITLWTARVT